MTNIEQGFAPANVKERNINIDFLKFIACLAVVGLHTLQKDLSVFNASLYHLCGFAIPVFFFSSGYILLQRKEITIRYSLKKSLNMIRVLLFWNICIAMGVVCLKRLQGEAVEWTSFFRNITYRPLIQNGFLWQFWYFGAMILMYLLLPFIHRAINNNKIGWQKLWSIFVIVCVCIQIVSLRRGMPVQKEVIQTFRIWTWIQYFLLGGGLWFFHIYFKESYDQKTCFFANRLDGFSACISVYHREMDFA